MNVHRAFQIPMHFATHIHDFALLSWLIDLLSSQEDQFQSGQDPVDLYVILTAKGFKSFQCCSTAEQNRPIIKLSES